MDQLRACYFCGAAEDVPLREVTVTPRRKQTDPEAQVALTLCRSCERKLERVLDGLFEHVESREPVEPDEDYEAHSDDDGEPEPIDRVDVASNRSDRETPSTPSEKEEVEPELSPEETTTEPNDSDGGIDPDEVHSDSVDDGPRVTARATSNAPDSLDGVSVAEYNRVMRLLQNREFPMERDAFVNLVINAYDLSEATVQTVLDAVIEKGALTDQAGELKRPDEEQST